jgi:hypothetical protein
MDEHSCPMLKAALGYAQMGFAVFPCAPRGKTPLVKRGFKAATRDEAQIHEWWTRWPDSNIGIATGTASGLLVVDIDSLDGAKHLGELAEQFGKLPRTARVVTGKGYHLYFCLPASCGRVPNSAENGLDIRGDGGYVIAPPSVHEGGSRYGTDSECPLQIADAPQWLINFARNRIVAPKAKPRAEQPAVVVPSVSLRPLAASLGSLQSPVPWSEAEEARLRSALKSIPAKDRDVWFKVGGALHDLANGDPRWAEPARRLWDEWSRSCPEKFDLARQETTWGSFGREYDGQRVTVATIYHWAGKAGWRDLACPTTGGDADAVTEPPQSTGLNFCPAQAAQSLREPQVIFARLAALSPVDYDRVRSDEAEKLNIRVGTLDSEVAKYRPQEDDAGVAGRALSLPAPDPWPEPIDGVALLESIVAAITRFVTLSPASALAAALWCVHAHAFELFYISPRLLITSPEKRCGKTTLLRVLTPLIPKPLSAANITVAAVFRTVEACRPSLLIDEADTFLKENEELRGIINSGHARDGQAVRLVGDDHEPRAFSTCCPVAIAAIGDLPGTIEDRSILISMRRRRPDEAITRFRQDRTAPLVELGRMIARFIVDNAFALRAADPIVPAALNDRAADNWRPLLAIADAAGGTWPERARAAAVSMSSDGPTREESIRTMLLSDIRAIFSERGVDRLSSEALVAELNAFKDRPWLTIRRGRELDPSRLAWMLKPFGIIPGTIRLDTGKTPKGYLRTAFNDAFERYLPSNAATPPHP